MRNKKLLSTMLAATLTATTMAMPVMAADLTGNVPVDLGVKSGVLRVQLPTRMAIEIDQYELDNSGAGTNQIASVPFAMTNKGNVNVKVDVTSAVTLGPKVKLASTKEGAVESSGDAYAWLAVASATDIDNTISYDDPTTSGDALVEDCSQLNETNMNVSTFASSGDVKQTYYLKAASGDAEDITYRTYKSGDAVVDPFARFDRLDGEMSTGDEVFKKLETSDVYVVSGDTVRKLVRGTKSGDAGASFTTGEKAYVVSGDAKTSNDSNLFTAANELYVYGEGTEVKDGKAAFRYVGKLSEPKTWSKNDIKDITINYTIEGVGASTYETEAAKCTQGLYPSVTGPKVSVSATGLVTISGLTADKNYQSAAISLGGEEYDIEMAPVTWGTNDPWSEEEGGTLTAQLGTDWVNDLKADGAGKIIVTLTDDTTIEANIVLS